MAHSLAHSNEAMAGQKSPGGNQPSLDSQIVWQARIGLAACFRMAARNGVEEGICNHFSALAPGYDDLFLVNPYGFAFRELTASKLLIRDFQAMSSPARGSRRHSPSISMRVSTGTCSDPRSPSTRTCPTPRR
jgi:Class II Aldolase and Adducin N-terminal domain